MNLPNGKTEVGRYAAKDVYRCKPKAALDDVRQVVEETLAQVTFLSSRAHIRCIGRDLAMQTKFCRSIGLSEQIVLAHRSCMLSQRTPLNELNHGVKVWCTSGLILAEALRLRLTPLILSPSLTVLVIA